MLQYLRLCKSFSIILAILRIKFDAIDGKNFVPYLESCFDGWIVLIIANIVNKNLIIFPY